MATRKKKRSRSSSREAPGWVWMLFGLSLGLVVAAAVYVSDRSGGALPIATPPAQTPSAQSRVEPAPETAEAPGRVVVRDLGPQTAHAFHDVAEINRDLPIDLDAECARVAHRGRRLGTA